jgi:tocopherol O-methyltransferase
MARDHDPDHAVIDRVFDYYQNSVDISGRLWSTAEAKALHYGLHDETTRGHSEALLNENRLMADIAGIEPGDRILDAGCGWGGSAFWNARYRGANVVGVSIAPRHIASATRTAAQRGLDQLTSFLVANYQHLPFDDSSFDVVWGCESFSHSPDKLGLLREAFRVLRPGGRLVIADAYQARPASSAREQARYDLCLRGFGLNATQWWDEYPRLLEEAGFSGVRRVDKSPAALPASRRMRRIGMMFLPLAPLLWLLHRLFPRNADFDHAWHTWGTAFAQYETLRSGMWIYGLFIAEKARN